MPSSPLRGSPRVSRPGQADQPARLTTTQLLALLREEGFRVTRRMLYHAIAVGALSRPPRAGNLRRWTALHLQALRHYLREHSRTQPDEMIGGGQ